MEKAKTASSTSHSSEFRWREEPHPPKLTTARAPSLSHGLSFSFSLLVDAAVAVANSPRVLVEAEHGSGGCWPWWCCGLLLRDVDGGDNNACHTQAMIRGEVGTWPAPGP